MQFPASTGEVATLLGVPEPNLGQLVRLRKLNPPPPIVGGRRLWEASHALQAARVLGIDSLRLRTVLSAGARQSPSDQPARDTALEDGRFS